MGHDAMQTVVRPIGLALLGVALVADAALAQQKPPVRTCEDLSRVFGLVWQGTTPTMTLQQLAAYAAPVFWLSPDEPTLARKKGSDIRVPAAMPFEPQAERPVVYYQLEEISGASGSARATFQSHPSAKGDSVIDLRQASVLRLSYMTYFPSEAGVGEHTHDIEPTEVRLLIGTSTGPLARQFGYQCTNEFYIITITRVTGEAHGNRWYYNVLDVDESTSLPIHMLVEEGKHAAATDKNADGYFTPGYDVSVRPNDAWGVRDTIRGGTLFTGKFEAWMAKVRHPEHRVLPPLPADSLLRPRLIEQAGDLSAHAQYELRPLPSSTLASADALLQTKIAEKEVENWPEVSEGVALAGQLRDWYNEGRELRPFSLSYMYDGDPGLSVALPLLFVKTIHEPLTGGYLVHRFTFKDTNLRDVSWMVLYTPSASRWFDRYAAAGFETNRFKDEEGISQTDRQFALELGVKFRFRAPVRLGLLTSFWGVRLGIKNIGAVDIDHMRYVFEFGAGVW